MSRVVLATIISLAAGAAGLAAAGDIFIKIPPLTQVDAVGSNRTYNKVCSFKALTAEFDREGTRELLAHVKRGDTFDETQIGHREQSYSYLLGKVTVSTITETRTGARVTLRYERCEQVR
ncbi:MAG: hypothetical protein AB7H88_06725 [Vicinamibacterales bacterium]